MLVAMGSAAVVPRIATLNRAARKYFMVSQMMKDPAVSVALFNAMALV
jgi:hypothetical protein